MERTIIKSRKFNAYFGTNHVVKNVNIDIPKNNIVAVMGPSGCGKTTYLRCINRMHELIQGATSNGEMILNNENVYEMHPIFVRLKIGMVFQRPNPFPNLSIYDNVIAGYKLNGMKLPKAERDQKVQESLSKAALWNEVKDSLHKKGTFLSGGQQQSFALHAPLPWNPKYCFWMNPLQHWTRYPLPVLKNYCMSLRKILHLSSLHIICSRRQESATKQLFFTWESWLNMMIPN